MDFDRAIFLDRDGVILEDNGCALTELDLIPLLGIAEALGLLKAAGYALVLVTNQAVVARGLISEAQLNELHTQLQSMLVTLGAPHLDAIYACPHHPNATDPAYRQICECRKPRPGLLLSAAKEHDIDLSQSFMIGDRFSDIVAGQSAGCKSILVTTGQHLAPPIQSGEKAPLTTKADHVCPDLLSAAHWIINHQ